MSTFDFSQQDFANENFQKSDMDKLRAFLSGTQAENKLQSYYDSTKQTVISGVVYFDFDSDGKFICMGAW